LRERGDVAGDAHRGAGDVVAGQIHFTGVNPGPDLDSACGCVLTDGGGAADRLPRSIERGQDTRTGSLDQAALVIPDLLPGCRLVGLQFMAVAGCGRDGLASGGHGQQDRGQNPAGLARRQRAGEEVRNLAVKRVAVPTASEAQGVVAGLLKIAGAGNVSRQVTSVAGGCDEVIETLNHQGRDVDRGQRRANVDLADHPQHAQECAGTDRHPLKSREQLARVW
jgi:hypothetical protein